MSNTITVGTTIQQSYAPDLLIVEGWGQPKPDEMFGAPVVRNGVAVSRGRYSSCDPRWQEDFNSIIDGSGVKVVADYRGHKSL